MIRLARLADYGLLISAALAELGPELVKLEQVAERTALTVPTVRKVMKLLVDGGVVASERGARGGYRLSRPASDVTLADVIHAVEGGVALTDCCRTEVECEVAGNCTIQANWLVVNGAVNDIFERITLADMLARPMTRRDVLLKAERAPIAAIQVES